MRSVALQPTGEVDRVLVPWAHRPTVRGKFFARGDDKVYLRGVTYGPFAPHADGNEYKSPAAVRRDFELMAQHHVNAVRTYTVPPRWLLDLAEEHGLQVIVGLPWEQHITFLDQPARAAAIAARLRQSVRSVADSRALFAFTVGNEIPAGIVRWHGKARIERFIARLHATVKQEAPEALITYVNYPSTEYLELPFLDFVCFNVYLESRAPFEAYLARLQNLSGNRPLVLGEIGLDSQRNGRAAQARTLDWQLRSTFACGCAGAFVFSWTDEWFRGGYPIDDWDFGLVSRNRAAKPALGAVHRAYVEAPFGPRSDWPRISVVVCSYNGARTIGQTLDHLSRLVYPNFEVIVVDDGSTDATPDIAAGYDVKLIRQSNCGLSGARNTGLGAASGEIIAYLDDDAYPDPHYLLYLAHAFCNSDFVAVGGPNLPPPGDGWVADAVANAPGGPLHILTSDTVAEHIPGCNFAVRRDRLAAIGGFDPTFRVAGDDVDVCWRLQAAGGTIGFHHAALVWHHRRNSALAYLKQQRGYGRAEALLERKWPDKYNDFGHMRWAGQLYGVGVLRALRLAPGRVYHGRWGCAPFQSLYAPSPSLWAALVQMPEWYLLMTLLLLVGLGGLAFRPLLAALPLFALAASACLAQLGCAVRRAELSSQPRGWPRLRLLLLIATLHFLQPIARLWGRVEYGLTPWRRKRRARARSPFGWSIAATDSIWSERWREAYQWLESVCAHLRARGAEYSAGDDFQRWDLRIRGGRFGRASLLMVIEEHGGGKQRVQFRLRPRLDAVAVALLAGAVVAVVLNPLFAPALGALVLWIYRDLGTAVALARRAVRSCAEPEGRG